MTRLAPGLSAAATHGILRTAHAARALSRRDTPERRGELARGLAYWAVAYEELPARERSGPRLRTYAAQFRKPVWPGDTLVTQGWNLPDGKVVVVATAKGRPDPVLTNAWAEIR